MYKLVFFVPASHLETVKNAVFSAGAGRQGEYEHCCWQTLGYGQFKPSASAKPFIGEAGRLEIVPEYRVETLVDAGAIRDVLRALKRAHPYEEPAFDVTEIVQVVL